MLRTLFCLVVVLLSPAPLRAQETALDWYISTSANLEDGASVRLSEGQFEVRLSNDWLCTVTPLSATARRMSCAKGSESVAALVDCAAPRLRDHAQLQFTSGSDRPDFIELSCQPSRRAALMSGSRESAAGPPAHPLRRSCG